MVNIKMVPEILKNFETLLFMSQAYGGSILFYLSTESFDLYNAAVSILNSVLYLIFNAFTLSLIAFIDSWPLRTISLRTKRILFAFIYVAQSLDVYTRFFITAPAKNPIIKVIPLDFIEKGRYFDVYEAGKSGIFLFFLFTSKILINLLFWPNEATF